MGCETVLGLAALGRGRLDEARTHIARSGALARELGLEADVVIADTNLAEIAYRAGELDESRRLWEGVLAWHEQHSPPESSVFALLGLGCDRLRRRPPRRGRRLFGRARRARRHGRVHAARRPRARRPGDRRRQARKPRRGRRPARSRRRACSTRSAARPPSSTRRLAASTEASCSRGTRRAARTRSRMRPGDATLSPQATAPATVGSRHVSPAASLERATSEERVTRLSHHRRRCAVVLGALIAIAAFAGAPSAQAATPSCSLASASRVKSALGVTVACSTGDEERPRDRLPVHHHRRRCSFASRPVRPRRSSPSAARASASTGCRRRP